jgi:hypothetical protein
MIFSDLPFEFWTWRSGGLFGLIAFCSSSPILLSLFVAWRKRRELRRPWLFAILVPILIYACHLVIYVVCGLIFNPLVYQKMPEMAHEGRLDHGSLLVKLAEVFYGGYSLYVQQALLFIFTVLALRFIVKRWKKELRTDKTVLTA